MVPDRMEQTQISWNGSSYVVAFHRDEDEFVVAVDPPNAVLRAILIERIQNATLTFYKGFNGPELR